MSTNKNSDIKSYDPQVVEFFKRHNMYNEEVFKFLYKRSTAFDYYDMIEKYCIGFLPIIQKQKSLFRNCDILVDFNIGLPIIINNVTRVVAVHELTHGIVSYEYLNKQYMDRIYWEVLSMFYEKLFELECGDPRVTEHISYLDSCIDETVKEEYRYALFARSILLENYDYDFEHTKRLSKELVKDFKKSEYNCLFY